MGTLKSIATDFFRRKPDERDHLVKADYAWHRMFNMANPDAHSFDSITRSAVCVHCGRSREQVRYDHLPAQCLGAPPLPDNIESVIAHEEANAWFLIRKAESVVPRIIQHRGLSAETLAFLHHTHGFDPEIVASVVEIPDSLIEGYHAAMATERKRSRSALKREILVAQPPQT